MSLMDSLKEKAKLQKKTIVLPEGMEERTIIAAEAITKEATANVILLGDSEAIKEKAKELDVNLENVAFNNPETDIKRESYIKKLVELRKSKGLTYEQASTLLCDPLYWGTMMVKSGDADGMVAGAINSTVNVLRPAFQIIKTAPGIKVVSSCFIMEIPNCELGENGLMIFGDCAVNPEPDAEQLAAIAISSAATAKALADIEPKVAMLSFSTKGSAKHPLVDKVVEATKIVQCKYPDLNIDGELQADAALIESVGSQKSPGSSVAGKANVLIFPDLQSGNIGYKLVQRLAGAQAIGPVIQGLDRPVNDLSRGCSWEDIANVVAITAVQAQS